jgi:homoserine kinase type II
VGTFTVLDAAELAQLAKMFCLGELRAHQAIAAGTINSNFAVETDEGRFFIRVNEGKAEADVAWEARVVTMLSMDGVPTPRPLATADGRPFAALPSDPTKWVTVFGWRPGRHLAAEQVTALHADRLGEALARMHVVGRKLTEPAPPPSDERLAAVARLTRNWTLPNRAIELRPSIYDQAHLVTRFEQQIEPVRDPQLDAAKRVLREEVAAAAAASAIRRAATHGLIHGDLFRDNVLWDGDAVSALLDFEQASGGSLTYDLAVCINDWCWTGAPRLDLAAAMLAGYQRVRPLPPADRAALPVEVRAAAARFTITRITDVYLARVMNPEKDFRDFLARCNAWRSSALRGLSDLV